MFIFILYKYLIILRCFIYVLSISGELNLSFKIFNWLVDVCTLISVIYMHVVMTVACFVTSAGNSLKSYSATSRRLAVLHAAD